ncbi:AAA domain-containing protein [Mycoplasma sp. T363T]|uniref:DEAD/DEAH box helicase n=1 Tax=Mycoplasma bradburyae TaxID=2963128 RepID=UPI002341A5F1|nr:AAA domain-containing protein [Mycoplasma bradburyae]MDC4163114.1 AAA domain-containing protein [Mycoplasma bradburyae]
MNNKKTKLLRAWFCNEIMSLPCFDKNDKQTIPFELKNGYSTIKKYQNELFIFFGELNYKTDVLSKFDLKKKCECELDKPDNEENEYCEICKISKLFDNNSDSKHYYLGYIFLNKYKEGDKIKDPFLKIKINEKDNSDNSIYVLNFSTYKNDFFISFASYIATKIKEDRENIDILEEYDKYKKELKEIQSELLDKYENKEPVLLNELLEHLLNNKFHLESNIDKKKYWYIEPKEGEESPYFRYRQQSYYLDIILDAINLINNKENRWNIPKNLERYLGINESDKEEKYNFFEDENNDKSNEEFQKNLEKFINPEFYPKAKFIGNPKYNLTLMQQVAINISVQQKSENIVNDIWSVNGPPGTGKTTLLKDIFAEIICEQAELLSKESLNLENIKDKENKIRELIRNNNNQILVLSSNNGAVQNIVNELPLIPDDLPDFLKDELDYFKDVNKNQTSHGSCNKSNKITFGQISLEGGSGKKEKRLEELYNSIIQWCKKNENEKRFENSRTAFNELLSSVKEINELHREVIGSFKIVKNGFSKKETYNDFIKYEYLKYQKNKQINDFFTEITENITEELNNLSRLKKVKDGYQFKPKIEHLNQDYSSSFFSRLFKTKKYKILSIKKENADRLFNFLEKLNKKINNLFQLYKNAFNKYLNNDSIKLIDINNLELLITEYNYNDKSINREEKQKDNPYSNEIINSLRMLLFVRALKFKKEFICKYVDYFETNNYKGNEFYHLSRFIFPITSSTFASFKNIYAKINHNNITNNKEGSINDDLKTKIKYAFVDEAGQAVPWSLVGALMCANKVIVVGDPDQIKPVLTTDSYIQKWIKQNESLDDEYFNPDLSVQTFVDRISNYYNKNENRKNSIKGLPLWVHRRCDNPMFSISNEISYNGKMVKVTKDSTFNPSCIINIPGEDIKGHNVERQINNLPKIIDKIKEICSLADSKNFPDNKDSTISNKDIFIISPFKEVSSKIKYNKYLKDISCGTVHTFQGKEAKVVILMLGVNKKSSGAAKWVVKEPNLINVAVTRAKQYFFVVCDFNVYKSIHNDTFNTLCKLISKKNSANDDTEKIYSLDEFLDIKI